MRYIHYLIWLVLGIFGVTFGVLNASLVKIDYYFNTTEVSLALLLALSLAVGVLVGWLALASQLLRLRVRNRALSRQLSQAETALHQARADAAISVHSE